MGFFIVSLHVTSTIAQKSYDLNQYKYRFQNFKYLTVTVNGGLYFFGGEYYKNVTSERYEAGTRMDLNTSFGQFCNRNSSQMDLTGRTSVNTNFNRKNRDTLKIFSYYASVDVKYRKYNSKNQFLFIGSNSNIENSWMDEKAVTVSGNSNQIRDDLNVFLGLGKGRLELISDAAFAQFIVNDLMKEKIVSIFSESEVEDFSKVITNVLNTRVIDFRFRLDKQVRMLDSFFAQKFPDVKRDINFYSILYDNWLYANIPRRFTGKRSTYYLSFGKVGNLAKREDRILQRKTRNNDNRIFISLNTELVQSFAKNLHVNKEFTYNAEFGVGQNWIERTSSNTSVYSELFVANKFSFKYLYTPNTRTFLIYSPSILLRTIKYSNSSVPDFKNFATIINSLNFYRWFSPNLSLNIVLNMFYEHLIDGFNVFDKSKQFEPFGVVNFPIDFRLVYSIL